MVENDVEVEWKIEYKQEITKKQQHQCVYEVSIDTCPSNKVFIINIITITLMTQLTVVKSSLLTHKDFTFNGETPQMALVQREHSNGQCPSFPNVFASPLFSNEFLGTVI